MYTRTVLAAAAAAGKSSRKLIRPTYEGQITHAENMCSVFYLSLALAVT